MAKLLLVCPTAPGPGRTGLAIRAAMIVHGLSRHHHLSVAVVRSSYQPGTLDWVQRRAAAVLDVDLAQTRASSQSWVHSARGREVASEPLPDLVRQRPPSLGGIIASALGTSFDAVVVMATYLAGVAVPFLDEGLPAVLDAFDNDASTCTSLTLLDPSYGEQALRYDTFQRKVFPWFERICFASLLDAVPPFIHLPNAVPLPPSLTTRVPADPLDLLFVGTQGYLPNRDALDRLRDAIVPAIRHAGVDVRLHHPGVDDPVLPYYEIAHIAAVPLRAGGGTRVKILEAFAHGCPVVSTPTGARGLAAQPGTHLVVTTNDHDDRAFAEAVVALARDDARRVAMAAQARAFVAAEHDLGTVGEQLATLVGDIAEQRSAGKRTSLGSQPAGGS